jgi:hypothetical protein
MLFQQSLKKERCCLQHPTIEQFPVLWMDQTQSIVELRTLFRTVEEFQQLWARQLE